ncbi:uncharacterized protein BXZ73DRAFT_97133 [Epithele typhae]|uniref:uncharacterized protein n=1 Tax=Epithele typhae TaxID=378194 RepID=UPI002007B3A6|nr:uncharacterized protein BXZ73DRAFT_97133 [Epithele typhae]KAH9943071.1 hypothetical protein BXZ73DRAFT_97133 [Epithele typhae]
MDPSTDIVLRYEYATLTNPNAEPRTMQVRQIVEGAEPADLYKRKNAETSVWENAGQIEWSSNTSGAVYFGVERAHAYLGGGRGQISIRELRKPKKPSSQSRRFKVNGTEYKWKLAENNTDMTCVSDSLGARGKPLATWTDATRTLRVAERAEPFLDRVVVTCLLHVWFRRWNAW